MGIFGILYKPIPLINKQEQRNVQAIAPVPAAPQIEKVAEATKEVVTEIPVAQAPIAPPTVKPAEEPIQQPSKVIGTNEAMQFIFKHESSNNPHSINAESGACGLGQAWPCSKLLNVCGSLDNVECQMQFFNTYAVERYGSWQGAMGYWQQNSWW